MLSMPTKELTFFVPLRSAQAHGGLGPPVAQMRKLSLITAVVACVVLPSVALATHGGHHGGGGHGGGHWAGSTSGPIGGGLHGHGAGHGRYWHGLWYEEGVGHCWRLTPDGYVWACD
jgi:hypothetical protein